MPCTDNESDGKKIVVQIVGLLFDTLKVSIVEAKLVLFVIAENS